MFLVITVGNVLSKTVTMAVPEALLPLPSVTVSVTALSPTLKQVNIILLSLYETDPQISEDPLSTALSPIVTLPVASN